VTVTAPDLWPRKRNPMFTRERDAFLRENATVDVPILARELNFTERSVIMYQRKLGIRPFTGNPGRRKPCGS
jgi:hypothetical protein